VPAATFVLGVLLGGATVGLVTGRGDDVPASARTSAPADTDMATDTDTDAATATPPPDAAVTVPRSCLELADTGDELAQLVTDAARAAAELDAAELSGIVRRMEQAQAGVEQLSSDCRSGADPVP
jgi:hypothetical protein